MTSPARTPVSRVRPLAAGRAPAATGRIPATGMRLPVPNVREDGGVRNARRRGLVTGRRRPVVAAVGGLMLAGSLSGCGLIGQPQNKSAELAEWFTVTSPVFRDGQEMPPRYGCTKYSGGQGKTPPLRWSPGQVSGSAKSFAIVMDDPDAGSGAYVHWVIAGIGGNTNELVEGSRPEKTWVEGLNTSKKADYVPPCPPKGEKHRYRYTIYALDDTIPFKSGAPMKDSLNAIAKHTVGRGRITGNFGTK